MSIDVSTLSIELRSKGIAETAEGLNKVFKEAKKAEDRVTTLTARVEKLSAAFVQGSATAQAFQQSMAKTKATSSGIDTAMNALSDSLGKLGGQMKNLSNSINSLKDRSEKFNPSVRANTKAMQDAHAAARGLSGSLGALWVTYGNMLPLAAGLAIGASFKQIVTVGKDVEHTLEGIRVKGGETIQSMQEMKKAVLELGQGIYGPQEVAKAFETLILAGKSSKEAMVGVKDALNLATVGGTSIEKAAYTLVQVSTSLGMTANGFGRVADVIAATAAASMSSVESISEAFKSGSAVGKLYGATLEDIGTSFAALSNLGIQGSAAGTSLKNFYKELASEGKKVQQTFSALGITLNKDLRDAAGNFKPLAEIIPILSNGLDKLSAAAQKDAIARLSNERGLKTIVELLSLYRTKGEEAGTAFAEMQEKIRDSFGYTAASAAALSLTTENQFKSVANTLKTSFVKAFDAIQPQMSLIATKLRATFASPEFINGISQVAVALGKLAGLVVENIELITKLVIAILGLKVLGAIAAGISAASAALTTFAATTTTATTALTAFQALLGPLRLLLIAVAGAMVIYNASKKDLYSPEQQEAINYINNFTAALTEEETRLKEQIRLMKEGKTAADAYTESMRNQQLEVVRSQGAAAVAIAQAEVDKRKKQMSTLDASYYDRAKSSGEFTSPSNMAQRVLDAEMKLFRVQAEVNKKYDEARDKLKSVVALSEEKAKLAKEEAEANKTTGNGTGTLTTLETENASALNDIYASKLTKIQAEVEVARRELKATESANEALFKTGQIGRLEVIQRNGMAAVKMYEEEARAYEEMIAVAAPKNKENVRSQIGNKLAEAQANASQELIRIKEQESIRFTEIEKFTTEHQIKELEARGKFVEANQLKYGELQKTGLSQLDSDIELVSRDMSSALASAWVDGGAAIPGLIAKFEMLTKARDAFIKEGEARGNVASFEQMAHHAKAALREVQGAVEGVKLAAEIDGGWEAAFDAAGAANRIRQEALPALQEMAAQLKALSEANPTNGALAKQAEEFANAVQRMGLAYDDAFGIMAESAAQLGNKLEESFGRAAGAVGKLVSVMAQQKSSQDKINASLAANLKLAGGDPNKVAAAKIKASKATAEAEIQGYANMASAAKGFFKEGSKGYKALEAAEQSFRAFEMALALEAYIRKLFFTQAETAAVITAEGVKAGAVASGGAAQIITQQAVGTAAATTAVATQATGDPYTAWIRMAAMAAAMAALGFAVSGGKGGGVDVAKQRQASQGTGTVFGDEAAKSESISNSLALLQENSSIELQYSQGMLAALRNIDLNIKGMATSVLRASGLRGTRLDELEAGVGSTRGSWLGFNKSSTELKDQGIFIPTQSIASILTGGFNAQKYTETETTKSSWWGLKKKTSTSRTMQDLDADITAQFQATLKGLADGIVQAVGVFGKRSEEAMAIISQTTLSVGMISLKGLSGEEIEAELQAVFSKAGDEMAHAIMPSLEPFQRIGEGYFETLIRVANGVDVAKYALEKLGLTMIDYTNIVNKQGDVSTELVRESILKVEGTGIFDTIKTEAVTVTKTINSMSDVAARGMTDMERFTLSRLAAEKQLGQTVTEVVVPASEKLVERLTGVGEIMRDMDGTAEELAQTYTDLLEIQVLLNAAGLEGENLSRAMIRGAGGLSALSDGAETYFDNFLTDSEKAAAKTAQLAAEFAKLGLVLPSSKDQFKLLVEGLDDGTEAGSKLVGKLLTLSGEFIDVAEAAERVKEANISDAMEKLDAAFSALQRAVDKEKERINARYDAEIAAIKVRTDAQLKAQKDQLKTAEESLKAITTIFDSLKNALKSTQIESVALTAARRREAQATLKGIASSGGDLTKAAGLDGALQAISKPSEGMFSTFQAYALDQAKTSNVVGELLAQAGSQKDAAQLTIDRINATIEAIEKNSEAQIKALEEARDRELEKLDATLEKAQQQIDALHGIDNSVKSVGDALKAFGTALTAAKAASSGTSSTGTTSSGGTSLGGTLASAGIAQARSAVEAYAAMHGNAYYQLPGQKLYDRKLDAVRSILHIQTHGLNDPKPLSAYTDEELGVDNKDWVTWTGHSETYWKEVQKMLDAGQYPTPDTIEDVWKSFDVGTNYVPYDMTANIHEGERIIPAADNAELMNRLRKPDTDMNTLIADLKQCIQAGDLANVQQTKEIVKMIKKWDGDGLPEERDVSE